MTDTESGPEEGPERIEWLKKIGKDKDGRGRPTTIYQKKGGKKGKSVFEVRPVNWRIELVSTLFYASS